MKDPHQVAASALAAGNPLGALDRVALRDDPAALAMRGAAMAQLGEFTRARQLLLKASRTFGNRAPLSRARCITALAEIALATRDLKVPLRTLRGAIQTFEAQRDLRNAVHAQLLLIRTLVVSGKLQLAEEGFDGLDLRRAQPVSRAIAELIRAEIAVRQLQAARARTALERARSVARAAAVPMLQREIERAIRELAAPSAREIARGDTESLGLEGVQRVLASGDFVVDACRREVQRGKARIGLERRPVLFALLRTLAEAWPNGVARDGLILRGFEVRKSNDSHRARLRVELGRLRKELDGLATIQADARGFVLDVRPAKRAVVIAPLVESDGAALLALLADGEAWSTSALALALGSSQRTVQRTLLELAAENRVRSMGRGRGQRWFSAPIGELATAMLLPFPTRSQLGSEKP